MAKWENCEIKVVTVREAKQGMFKYTYGIYYWEAHMMTPSGPKTLYKSNEFEPGTGYLDIDSYDSEFPETACTKGMKGNEKCDAEYERMIATLGEDGWQPSRTNRNGWIVLLKRQVGSGEVTNAQTANLGSLLEQLANLRNADVLTEQEFQTKKAEILRRM